MLVFQQGLANSSRVQYLNSSYRITGNVQSGVATFPNDALTMRWSYAKAYLNYNGTQSPFLPLKIGSIEYSDAATIGLVFTITPNTDTADIVDANTVVLLHFIESTSENAQFVDSNTVVLLHLIESTQEGKELHDSATVVEVLTPSGVDLIPNADVGSVTLNLIPSSTDVEDSLDSGTAKVSITPTSSDIGLYTESGTNTLSIVASSADILSAIDQQIVAMGILPSSVDTLAALEANTASVVIQPSSTDGQERYDSQTAVVSTTPTSTDTAQYVESATTQITFGIGGTDVLTTAGPSDLGTATLAFTPFGTEYQTHTYTDANLVYIKFQPMLRMVPIGKLFGHWQVRMVSRIAQANNAKRFFAKSAKPRWKARAWKM